MQYACISMPEGKEEAVSRVPDANREGNVSNGAHHDAAAGTRRVTVTLPAHLVSLLHRESAQLESTVSGIVRDAVAEYFAERRTTELPEFVGMAEHPDDTLSERIEEIIERDFRADRSTG